MGRTRHIPWYQHGCTGRNQILLGGIFSYQLQCLKNSAACEQNYCQNTGLNSNWKYSVPNQVEYFHSCPSSGDHCGYQGRSLCGASSAQLWRWCVASHRTEISMPEEGMASIKYDVCYLGTAWRAPSSLKLFLPSLSPGFLVPTLVWIGPRLLHPYGWKRSKKLSIGLVWWSEESNWKI